MFDSSTKLIIEEYLKIEGKEYAPFWSQKVMFC